MTVRDALSEGRAALVNTDTETPELDTSLLLAQVRGVDRARLLMDLNEPINEEQLNSFRKLSARRAEGEPVAWITGIKEFWGRNFVVGEGVLCPRPDTEALVETALSIMDGFDEPGSLHDCCTGPGTIALSLAADRPLWKISASDISEHASNYFQTNNNVLTSGTVSFTLTSLMEKLSVLFDIIVSNPPYLTAGEIAEKEAMGWKEPMLALNGGGCDGLDLIRELIPQAAKRLKKGGIIVLEAHPPQMPIIKRMMLECGFDSLEIKQDLAGKDRVLVGRYNGEI